jgi:hypothetical protein
MPKVCVLTPTDRNTKGIKAFSTELQNDVPGVVLQYFEANGDLTNLASQANQAIAASPDALLAAGSSAAYILQSMTTTIPIVQGLGGEIPDNKNNNLTGYYSNAAAVAQTQLNKIQAQDVTILYDPLNEVSKNAYDSLSSGGKNVTPLLISDPGQFGNSQVTTLGFMLIPNAMYYGHAQDIVNMVDNNKAVKSIYYPEHEFRDLHRNKNKVKVHGHHVVNTYTNAADLVAAILSKTYVVPNLPAFTEAALEPDI